MAELNGNQRVGRWDSFIRFHPLSSREQILGWILVFLALTFYYHPEIGRIDFVIGFARIGNTSID